jgi:glycosyl transferase family 25
MVSGAITLLMIIQSIKFTHIMGDSGFWKLFFSSICIMLMLLLPFPWPWKLHTFFRHKGKFHLVPYNFVYEDWRLLLDIRDKTKKELPKFREINNGKITSYIINLERAQERLNYVLPQISSLGIPYEIIPAIDGNKILLEPSDNADFVVNMDTYKYIFRMQPEPGTIGCSLSHEKALKQFLRSDNEFAIIFEDDVFFDPRKLSVLIEDLVQKKHKWDIVSFELNHHGHPVSIAELPYDKKLVLYLTNVKHSGAYMINRKTANKLIKNFFPIEMPFDHYFSRSWEHGIQFCGVEPRPGKQEFGNSQIKNCEKQKTKSLFTAVTSFFYNVNSSIAHSLYNFFCYLFRWF